MKLMKLYMINVYKKSGAGLHIAILLLKSYEHKLLLVFSMLVISVFDQTYIFFSHSESLLSFNSDFIFRLKMVLTKTAIDIKGKLIGKNARASDNWIAECVDFFLSELGNVRYI